MRPNHLWLVAGVSLGAISVGSAPLSTTAGAQGAALAGQVSSAQEGAMEGVLVSVKKDGSTIATTVVTNDKGEYSFPANRLQPGKYAVTIRAAGYVLDGPKSVDIAAGGAKADIKLNKARNLTSMLSNGEWLASAPGADSQKAFLTGCTSCHTLQRVFTAVHSAEEWEQVFNRMGRYYPGSTPSRPQLLVSGGARSERPRINPAAAKAAAEFLVSVSLSNPDAKEYDLKTLPRPKGAATKVIYTEYDLPRKEALPHDVVVDADGKAWYSDFGSMFVGELDPKTGQVTDYPIPVLREEQPKGTLDLELDPSGNIWVALMYQSGLAKVERKTREVKVYPYPKEWLSFNTQASMVSPNYSNVDGKVWSNNQETRENYRLDVATGKYENLGISKDPRGKNVSGYGMPTDHDNNVFMLEFSGTSIGRRNAKTGEVTIWPTPTSGSKPRRGRFDEQNRLWFAEYGSNGIGMFDPKTDKITEWVLPTKWDTPYDVVPAKNGEVWAGSMHTDLVTRLDPKTGSMVEFLLPRSTNIRRVFVEETGPRPVLWVGSNHGASIVKVEPLD
ncbi:MAG: virginiamycin lyase [Alphaproteobacteria bacterium]|nr:virginiamycin lyase [Alphaproteobacteria bacterium]